LKFLLAREEGNGVKKIGFIDYYLDEWHADKYPEWIETATGGEMKVSIAYGIKDAVNGLSNSAWCGRKGIQLAASIEEVVDKSDYLIVLSPDNPEYHEELSILPLQSGKPTYIDKTFAPDRKTAFRLFDMAQKKGTPLYSTSALRFATEYIETERKGIESICSVGPGRYDNYSIHQIEPIVSLMGSKPERIMFIGTDKTPAFVIGFADGRQAILNQFGRQCPFSMVLNYDGGEAAVIRPESDYFGLFIKNMIHFFETGESLVNPSETIAIITIYEYGFKAAKAPYEWIRLPTE
jgi:hypothetical protein